MIPAFGPGRNAAPFKLRSTRHGPVFVNSHAPMTSLREDVPVLVQFVIGWLAAIWIYSFQGLGLAGFARGRAVGGPRRCRASCQMCTRADADSISSLGELMDEPRDKNPPLARRISVCTAQHFDARQHDRPRFTIPLRQGNGPVRHFTVFWRAAD